MEEEYAIVHICVRAITIKTAANGTFTAPAWRAEWSWPPINGIRGVAYVTEEGFFSVRDKLRGPERWMTTNKGLYVARATKDYERRYIGDVSMLAQHCARNH